MFNFFKTKKGKLPVVREVFWELAPGAAYIATWHGEWRKKWYKGYELKITIYNDFSLKKTCEWKPVESIIYSTDVKNDLKKLGIKTE